MKLRTYILTELTSISIALVAMMLAGLVGGVLGMLYWIRPMGALVIVFPVVAALVGFVGWSSWQRRGPLRPHALTWLITLLVLTFGSSMFAEFPLNTSSALPVVVVWLMIYGPFSLIGFLGGLIVARAISRRTT